MFSTNMLFSPYAAVDERGCGKVDNGYSVGFAQVTKSPLSTGVRKLPQYSP
jgi:hypothetical protein